MTKYNFTRKPNGEAIISCAEFLRLLTTKDHGWGYNHLTSWSSLCKMLEPINVPDDKAKHRMLHLGAAVNMNDENDKRCGKRVFFTSFSFGPTENISMWTNYGIPNEEAVRLKFPNSAMTKWVELFNSGKIGVYGVGSDWSLNPLTAKAEAKLVQVAYWSKKEIGRNHEDPNEGLFFYDNERFRLADCEDVNAFMAKQPYMFKEYGWNYEKEIRLVLWCLTKMWPTNTNALPLLSTDLIRIWSTRTSLSTSCKDLGTTTKKVQRHWRQVIH